MQLVNILPVITAVCCFALIVVASIVFRPKQVVAHTYAKMSKQLKEKKGALFDYKRINGFLNANGAAYHYGKWIDPIKYIALSLIIGFVLFAFTIRYHLIVALISLVIGYQLPGRLLVHMNKKDNNRMLMQLQTIYNALSVQIKAGVHVSDAMAECYIRLPKGRLREALQEVSGDLFVRNHFETAINKFNNKFDNAFVDSLCIILLQAQESGQAVELLHDMSEQIKDMHSSMLLKKKMALERSVTFCLVGILGTFLVITVYAFIADVLAVAGSL